MREGTKKNRQPLVVGDVLEGGDVDPAGLLVEALVVPVRVEGLQLLGQAVMLSHEHDLMDGELRVLVGTGIPWNQGQCFFRNYLF